MFVVVTVFACWLGYELNWIRQRHQAGAWIEANPPSFRPMSKIYQTGSLPWSLRILGESPMELIELEIDDQSRLNEISKLFPEAAVLNYKATQ